MDSFIYWCYVNYKAMLQTSENTKRGVIQNTSSPTLVNTFPKYPRKNWPRYLLLSFCFVLAVRFGLPEALKDDLSFDKETLTVFYFSLFIAKYTSSRDPGLAAHHKVANLLTAFKFMTLHDFVRMTKVGIVLNSLTR